MEKEEKLKVKQEKIEAKILKERKKNSIGRKIRNFFLTVIFVAIVLVVGFFVLKEFLKNKEEEYYKKEMETYYDEGVALIDEEKYEEAIEVLNKVKDDSELYDDAQYEIDKATTAYIGDYIDKADKYLKDKKYDSAIDVFDKLKPELKNTKKIKEKISEIIIAKVDDKLSTTESGLVEKIIYLCNQKVEDNDILNSKLDEYIQKYKKEYIDDLNKTISSKNYSEKRDEVNAILDVLKGDDELKELLNKIADYKPTYLNNLDYFQTEGYIESSTNLKKAIKDNVGKSYENYLTVESTYSDYKTSIVYKLNGAYSKFSGTICLNFDNRSTQAEGKIVTIYGDDQVLYTSPEITAGVEPIDFEVDISGIDKLKIVVYTGEYISYFIANPILSK